MGGVGYEGDIITSELLHTGNQRKFIPILRRGEWRNAAPGWLAGKYYIDLRDGPSSEAQYQDLVTTILGSRSQAPPVAVRSSAPPSAPSDHQPLPTVAEPIRIVGIIADDVGEPRNDGTRGSALYAVPFRLSRRASGEWTQVFERVWNRPPRRTNMHRPGIAHVRSDLTLFLEPLPESPHDSSAGSVASGRIPYSTLPRLSWIARSRASGSGSSFTSIPRISWSIAQA